jgi:hypothetical protein
MTFRRAEGVATGGLSSMKAVDAHRKVRRRSGRSTV